MNKPWILFLVVVIIIGIVAYFGFRSYQAAAPVVALDPANATYVVDSAQVTLVRGSSSVEAAPGSASKTLTTLFGSPAMGDVNGDGISDAGVILVQNSGGSGTFYYVAADLSSKKNAGGTNAVLLGDRISPENISIQNGQIVVNYAARNPGEPMTTQPSVGVSQYFSVDASGTLRMVNKIAGSGERCGGNMTTAPTCIAGYHCAPEPGSHLPFGDVGGICVAD